MSVIEDAVSADKEWAVNFELGGLSPAPRRKLAVVACMDCRLTVEQILGLSAGDAHIIRNAGGIVTDDALRSLIISHHMLGTQEFMVINHTECGMMTFDDDALNAKLQEKTGKPSHVAFHAFKNLRENVIHQMQALRAHPWIPDEIVVRGFVYDVKTGELHEIKSETSEEKETPGLTPLAPLPPLTALSF